MYEIVLRNYAVMADTSLLFVRDSEYADTLCDKLNTTYDSMDVKAVVKVNGEVLPKYRYAPVG